MLSKNTLKGISLLASTKDGGLGLAYRYANEPTSQACAIGAAVEVQVHLTLGAADESK